MGTVCAKDQLGIDSGAGERHLERGGVGRLKEAVAALVPAFLTAEFEADQQCLVDAAEAILPNKVGLAEEILAQCRIIVSGEADAIGRLE